MYALTTSPSKGDLAKSLGAHGYLLSSPTTVDEIKAMGGAKVILCTAPRSKPINDLIPAVARNGTVMLVGIATDGNIEINNLFLVLNRASLRGWTCGAAEDTEECINFATTTGIYTSRLTDVIATYILTRYFRCQVCSPNLRSGRVPEGVWYHNDWEPEVPQRHHVPRINEKSDESCEFSVPFIQLKKFCSHMCHPRGRRRDETCVAQKRLHHTAI